MSLGGKPAARMGRAVQHQESAAAVVSNVGRPGGGLTSTPGLWYRTGRGRMLLRMDLSLLRGTKAKLFDVIQNSTGMEL